MPDRSNLKQTPVAEVSALSTMKALVVHHAMPIEEAVERYSSNQGQHGIFLVNQEGRFTGLVNNYDLLNWARSEFDLVPGQLPMPVHRMRRYLAAATIGELAIRDSMHMVVKLTDTLVDALNAMAQYDLEDIAVVDDEGRVVNDLRLSELLAFALRSRAQRRNQGEGL